MFVGYTLVSIVHGIDQLVFRKKHQQGFGNEIDAALQVFLFKIYGCIFTHTENTAADDEIGAVQFSRRIDIVGVIRGASDFRKIAGDAYRIGEKTSHGIVNRFAFAEYFRATAYSG